MTGETIRAIRGICCDSMGQNAADPGALATLTCSLRQALQPWNVSGRPRAEKACRAVNVWVTVRKRGLRTDRNLGRIGEFLRWI